MAYLRHAIAFSYLNRTLRVVGWGSRQLMSFEMVSRAPQRRPQSPPPSLLLHNPLPRILSSSVSSLLLPSLYPFSPSLRFHLQSCSGRFPRLSAAASEKE